MLKVVSIALLLASVSYADPGIFGEHGFGPLHAGPGPYFGHGPVLAHAPAPIIAPAPIYKAIPAPIFKAVAPATSYATVTQVHVTHPAVVKAVVAAPPPIVKTIAYPAHYPAFGHGFH